LIRSEKKSLEHPSVEMKDMHRTRVILSGGSRKAPCAQITCLPLFLLLLYLLR
jgi:hypothetical protein